MDVAISQIPWNFLDIIISQKVPICDVMKTNMMHYLSSVYFVSQPLHVSGIFVAHLQEVYCIYSKIGSYYIYIQYIS